MEKYTPQHIQLSEAYTETGVSFGEILDWRKATEWWYQLDRSYVEDGLLTARFKGYSLHFIITSSALLSGLVVRGPRKGRKDKFLEYAIWIPYSPVINDPRPLTKLTTYFREGVAEVLRQLEYKEESIKSILEGITDQYVP